MPARFRLHVRAPAGHPHRGDRADLRPGRGRDPRGRARRRAGDDSRQHRADPVVHRSWPTSITARSATPTAKSSSRWSRSTGPTAELRRPAAAGTAAAVPAMHVLLPAGGHHQPNPQLRPARPDRRAGGRRPPRGNLRRAKKLQQRAGQDSRHRRRPPPPDHRLRRRFASTWTASCRRSWGLPSRDVTGSVLVSLSGTTQVTPNYWVNPENRVNYVAGRADAAGPDRHRGRLDEHADHQRQHAGLGDLADPRRDGGRARSRDASPHSS